jgi:hypothetical protein
MYPYALSIDDYIFEALGLDNIIKNNEFIEFCNNIDKLSNLISTELYMEARIGTPSIGTRVKRAVVEPIANTKSAVGEVIDAYDDVTHGGGELIKGGFSVIGSLISLIARLLEWLLLNISKIPTMIASTIRYIEEIPPNVRNKIHGNIKLYIAANDIAFFYTNIFPYIDNIIQLTQDLSKGSFFNMAFNSGSKFKIFRAPPSDVDTINKMKKWFKGIAGDLRFAPSVIDLKDSNNIDLYFGNNKNVDFVDLQGNRHNTTYYDGLSVLSEDMRDKLPKLDALHRLIGGKVSRTQSNGTFSKLAPKDQNSIRESFEMISKTVKIISDVNRYIITDMNTIRKACSAILKKKGIK